MKTNRNSISRTGKLFKKRLAASVTSGLLAVLLAVNVGLSGDWLSASAADFDIPAEPASIEATRGDYYADTLDWNFNFENASSNAWTMSNGAWYWSEARAPEANEQDNYASITSGRYFYLKKQSPADGWAGHHYEALPTIQSGLFRHYIFNDEDAYTGEALHKSVSGTANVGYALSTDAITGEQYYTDGYSVVLQMNSDLQNTSSPESYISVKPAYQTEFNAGDDRTYLNFYVKSEAGDKIYVTIVDHEGNSYTTEVSLTGSVWQRKSIALQKDTDVDHTKITEIRFSGSKAGKYYFDSVFFSNTEPVGGRDKPLNVEAAFNYNRIYPGTVTAKTAPISETQNSYSGQPDDYCAKFTVYETNKIDDYISIFPEDGTIYDLTKYSSLKFYSYNTFNYYGDWEFAANYRVFFVDKEGDVVQGWTPNNQVKLGQWGEITFDFTTSGTSNLSTNANFDPASVTEIRIGAYHASDYYLDNIRLVDANGVETVFNRIDRSARVSPKAMDSGLSNGNYVLAQRPTQAGVPVTTTQTITGLDSNLTYRIGVYVKTVGYGKSYLTANGETVYFANNLSTTGNGNPGDGRNYDTQNWNFSAVCAKPDKDGKITLTFTSETTQDQMTQTIERFGVPYTLFADNMNICVYKESSAPTKEIDVTYYDYSFWGNEYSKFFEFVWNGIGAHSGVEQGLVEGVLDGGSDGDIRFTNNVEKYNTENDTENSDHPEHYTITAALLNGEDETQPASGLFREGDEVRIFEDTLTFYENGTNTDSYVFDSNLFGHATPSSEHGYADLNQYTGGFFPLDNAVDENGNVFDAEGMNRAFHFGMTMHSPFYLTYDQNKENSLVFEGDDDFWLFIDGVLVVDAGGAHRPLEEATLNFTDNTVTIVGYQNEFVSRDVSIADIVRQSLLSSYGYESLDALTASGNTADIDEINAHVEQLFGSGKTINNIDSSTHIAAGEHEFKIFYMERCSEASDLKLTLNLAIPELKTTKTGRLDGTVNSGGLMIEDGDTIEYTITVTNSGGKAVSVPIIDTLPAGMTFADGSLTVTSSGGKTYSGGFNNAGTELSLTVDEIDEGETVTITYRVTANEEAIRAAGSAAVNTVSVDGSLTCADPFYVDPITLEKTVSTSLDGTYSESVSQDIGGKVWFKLEVTNNSAYEITNVSLTDDRTVVYNSANIPANTGIGGTFSLGANETRTFTVEYPITAGDYLPNANPSFTNTAAVTGTMNIPGKDGAGNKQYSVGDTDDAAVTVNTPATSLRVVKEVSLSASSGFSTTPVTVTDIDGTVYYRITVTNDTPIPVNGITVYDDHSVRYPTSAAGETAANTALGDAFNLAAGESKSFTVSHTLTESDFVNGVFANTAYAKDNNDDRTDSDPVNVNLAQIKLTKTASTGSAKPGDDVTFTLTVENTGSVPLANVQITDTLAVTYNGSSLSANAPITVGDLGVGQDEEITVTYRVTDADLLLANQTVTNTATATGDYLANGSSGTVTSTDDDSFTVINPALRIVKDVAILPDGIQPAQLDDSAWSSRVTTKQGDRVCFRIRVTNTGNVPLENITLTDTLDGVVNNGVFADKSVISLSAGSSMTYYYTYPVPFGETGTTLTTIENIANASAKFNGSDVAVDNTNNKAYVERCRLAVEKTAALLNGETYPDNTAATVGDVITYKITVTNTGSAELENINVTDILPGTLSAWNENDTNISGLTILKLIANQSAEFRFVYTLTAGEAAQTTFSNTARAQAALPDDPESSVSASGTVGIPVTINRNYRLEKKVSAVGPDNYDWQDSVVVKPGDTVWYKITVVNTGNVAIDTLTVTDEKLGKTYTITDLPVEADPNSPEHAHEEIFSFSTADVTDITETFENTVRAAGTSYGRPLSTLEDSANVDFAELTVEKSADLAAATVGNVITYTITVTNTGSVDLSGVVVTDSIAPIVSGAVYKQTDTNLAAPEADSVTIREDGSAVIAALGHDETAILRCTYTVVDADLAAESTVKTNTARAYAPADDPDSDPIAEDSDSVTVPLYALGVEKIITNTPASGKFAAGDEVHFTITITNLSSEVDLDGITIADTLVRSSAPDTRIAESINWTELGNTELAAITLEPKASHELEYTYTIPENALGNEVFTNTVIVTAANPNNSDSPLTAQDDAEFTVAMDPSLRVTKDASSDTAVPGQTVTYTIKVENTGNTPLDVTLHDEMFETAGLFSEEIEGWPHHIGVIEPGKYVTCVQEFTVREGTAIGTTLTNTAVARAEDPRDPDGNPIESTGTKDITIVEAPEQPLPTISKSVDKSEAESGDTVSFTISVSNPSDVPIDDLYVYDPLLDAYWHCGQINAKGSWTAQDNTSWLVPSGAGGTVHTNTAYLISSEDFDPDHPEDTDLNKAIDSADADVTIIADPAVELVKTAAVSSVAPGSPVSYVITVTNTGNVTLSDLRVIDSLSGEWVQEEDENLSVDEAGVIIASLEPGEYVSLEYTVTTSDTAEPDSKLDNTATVTALDPTDPDKQVSDYDSASVTFTEKPAPAVTITKTCNVTSATAGDTVNYTLSVTNTGNVALENLEVSDPMLNYTYTIPSLAVNETWFSPKGALAYTIPSDASTSSLRNTAEVKDVANQNTTDQAVFGINVSQAPSTNDNKYESPSTGGSKSGNDVYYYLTAVAIAAVFGAAVVIFLRRRATAAK